MGTFELLQGQLLALNPGSLLMPLIPIVALCIPIVRILVGHQQKMAELYHGSQRPSLPDQDNSALREEVTQMRQQITQLALALDDLKQAISKDVVRERIHDKS